MQCLLGVFCPFLYIPRFYMFLTCVNTIDFMNFVLVCITRGYFFFKHFIRCVAFISVLRESEHFVAVLSFS